MTGTTQLCDCDDPTLGGGEHGDECRDCGSLIGRPIIGGEVHAGYTSLGNGPAFFDAKEHWHIDGTRYGINRMNDGEYVRVFGDADVVVPHHHEKARRLGVEAVSIDTVIHPDGSVEMVVHNRRLDDLPDGPTFPVETGDVSL